MKRVLIGAGHRHTLGDQGNPFEKELNGRKVNAVINLFRSRGGANALGWDLRCYTPNEGLGLFPGYLNNAPVSGFQDASWTPDLMVEFHSEGAGGSVRGGFVIYPDYGADIDVDIIRWGQIFPEELTKRVPGIRIRTINFQGRMSEKRTGVYLQYGARLGVFRDTARYAERTTRTIFEQGSHDNPEERAIMESDTFLIEQARAFLNAVPLFFDKISPGWNDAANPEPEYKPSVLPAKVQRQLDMDWNEVVAAGRNIVLDGITYVYDRKTLEARRAAACRNDISDDAALTRRKLQMDPEPEKVSAVFRVKAADGVNWRVTKYGTCIRSSALKVPDPL